MKISIIGAGGVRTPLIVQAIIKRQERLGITQLALMDIDADRLSLISDLSAPLEGGEKASFQILPTTNPQSALVGADFVITTFRVGGIESRVIDEQVPLSLGILGQETTGPGGFAMGMRSIPVLLDYISLMKQVCPEAWLINFANPAGMLAEAAIRYGGWARTAGICDAPTMIQRVASAAVAILVGGEVESSDVYLDYFGLNHLGWVRSVRYRGKDYLPELIEMIRSTGDLPGFPFDADFISALGLVPNEYLHYFYAAKESVQNILRTEYSRGQEITELNRDLFADLHKLQDAGQVAEMHQRYYAYLNRRGSTYMAAETGRSHDLSRVDPRITAAFGGEGYAGVALNLIETLAGASQPAHMILNVPNQGAVCGMEEEDVVEIPAAVGHHFIQPLAVGEPPGHTFGLMKQVKAYEQLTIEAAVEGSYSKALLALSIHPLVSDVAKARQILSGYIEKHGPSFPALA